jgi:1,4-alpha-glucan branching enzyme
MAPAAAGAAAAAAGTVVVHFAMVAPDAREVALVGDFNGWSPSVTPLRRATANGTWWVAVPLRAGRYTYAFLLDGRLWVPDPAAPLAPEDGFGRRNSVVVVTS